LTTPLVTNAGTLALSATGANVVTASTNGVERLRIASNGNVGIGIGSPAQPLDVGGAALFGLFGTQTRITSTATVGLLEFNSTSEGRIQQTGDVPLTFRIGASERLRITSAGNVGIGTSSPAAKLDILDGETTVLRVQGSGGTQANRVAELGLLSVGNFTWRVRGTNNSMRFLRDSLEYMRIDSAGNVGVGTSAPLSLLHTVKSESGSAALIHNLSNPNNTVIGTSAQLGLCGIDGLASTRGVLLSGVVTDAGNGHAFTVSTSATSATPTERLRITSAGNVGIGTSSPAAKLEVRDTTSSTEKLIVRGPETGTLADFSNGVNANFIIKTAPSVTTVGPSVTTALAFQTANTERMRITSAGNVGIGTTAPTAKLMSQVNTFTDADKLAFKAFNAQGVGVFASFQNSDTGTAFTDGFRVGINDSEDAVLFNLENRPMLFGTDNTERLRITSAGNVQIGQNATSAPGLNNAITGIAIVPDGSIFSSRESDLAGNFNRNSNGALVSFRRSGVQVGSITVDTTNTFYNTSSDYRLKEDAQPIANPSERLLALKPVNFAWKADGSRVDGFLAHEAQEVVPQAVTGEKDGEEMQAIDHSKLVPLLTAALQEALQKIEALEARITALEA
jgi:hypothetical protein